MEGGERQDRVEIGMQRLGCLEAGRRADAGELCWLGLVPQTIGLRADPAGGRQQQGGMLAAQQRLGAVLELGRRERQRRQPRKLLQLERDLLRDGEVRPATDHETGRRLGEVGDQRRPPTQALGAAHRVGHAAERCLEPLVTGPARHQPGDDHERREHGLGRGDAGLLAGVARQDVLGDGGER